MKSKEVIQRSQRMMKGKKEEIVITRRRKPMGRPVGSKNKKKEKQTLVTVRIPAVVTLTPPPDSHDPTITDPRTLPFVERQFMRESLLEVQSGTGANDIQIGGGHYKDYEIQPWDFIISANLGFLEGNVVKYICRWQDKGGIEDVKKARHYLDKLIEVIQKKSL